MVNSIYSSVKQISDTLFSSSGQAFRKALLVQWPQEGMWTIAFLTGTPGGVALQPPPALGGRFAKDRFTIDLAADTVTCPGQVSVAIRPVKNGGGVAAFGTACAGCPLVAQCTTSPAGRTITISAYEPQLARARAAQADPAWQADYRATRPKVERKIGHLMRRRHGGRRARVRGTAKVAADFSLLAAAVNLARLGMLGLRHTGRGWAAAAI